MKTMSTVHVVALAVAALGCATDLRSRRIPNLLTGTAAVAALLWHTWGGGLVAAGSSLAGLLVGLAIFFVPFALRGLGGGDVKLLAAIGAWVGPSDVFWTALYAGACGGVLALGTAAATGYLHTAVTNVRTLLMHWRVAGVTPLPGLTLESSHAPKLAYALPILCGTLVMTWLQ